MRIQFGLASFQPEWAESVVCLGTFDGVHLGHQAVIREAVAAAHAAQVPGVVVTFDRNPMATLAPDRCPEQLATLDQNLARFAECRASVALILPFDHALSQVPAEDFLNNILINHLKASQIVVGHDFVMGQGRVGTTEWLKSRIPTDVVAPFTLGGNRISSRQIRTWIASGDVELAAKSLGRPYALAGVVVKGQQLGRTIGYPTLNLCRTTNQVIPRDGIYAGSVGEYTAAISIGTRPTVGGTSRTIEAYLLDFEPQELYGEPIEIEFTARIRDEEKFDSLEAMTQQIERDVEIVRQIDRIKAADPSL